MYPITKYNWDGNVMGRELLKSWNPDSLPRHWSMQGKLPPEQTARYNMHGHSMGMGL